jgi:hypothetical protein
MPGTDEPVVDHATAVAQALPGLEVTETQFWLAALHTWHRTGNWDTAKLGPAPGKPGFCLPAELLPASCVVARKDRARASPAPTNRELLFRLGHDWAVRH